MVFKYIKEQRGVALVIAMVFSLVIFAAAMAFTYRLSSFIRTTRSSQVKSQSIYTTDVGLELLRRFFWINSCAPPGWCATTLGATNLTQTSYSDITANLVGILPANGETVTSQDYTIKYTSTGQINIINDSATTVDSYNYDVYLKDTPIQNTIEVLASSEQPAQEAKANTSAAIIFAIPCSEDYKQFGQCIGKEGSSGERVTATMRTPF